MLHHAPHIENLFASASGLPALKSELPDSIAPDSFHLILQRFKALALLTRPVGKVGVTVIDGLPETHALAKIRSDKGNRALRQDGHLVLNLIREALAPMLKSRDLGILQGETEAFDLTPQKDAEPSFEGEVHHTLHLETLGEATVSLKKAGNKVRIEIAVETLQAKDWLEEQLKHSAFNKEGITTEVRALHLEKRELAAPALKPGTKSFATGLEALSADRAPKAVLLHGRPATRLSDNRNATRTHSKGLFANANTEDTDSVAVPESQDRPEARGPKRVRVTKVRHAKGHAVALNQALRKAKARRRPEKLVSRVETGPTVAGSNRKPKGSAGKAAPVQTHDRGILLSAEKALEQATKGAEVFAAKPEAGRIKSSMASVPLSGRAPHGAAGNAGPASILPEKPVLTPATGGDQSAITKGANVQALNKMEEFILNEAQITSRFPISGKTHLKMQVAELGEVSVEITNAAQKVGVEIGVESNRAKSLIAGHLKHLTSQLDRLEIKVAYRPLEKSHDPGPHNKRERFSLRAGTATDKKTPETPRNPTEIFRAGLNEGSKTKKGVTKKMQASTSDSGKATTRLQDPQAGFGKRADPVEESSEDGGKESRGFHEQKSSLQSNEFGVGAKHKRGEKVSGVETAPLTRHGNFPTENKLVAPVKVRQSQVPEMIHRIAKMVENRLQASNSRIEVQLDVETLGLMKVDATRHHDSIHLQIQVENEEAKRWVESHLRPLNNHMTREGFRVDNLQVSVQGERSEGQSKQGRFYHPSKFAGEKRYATPSGVAGAAAESAPVYSEQRSFGYNTLEVWG
ncbi:MAG: flagellar hook-length control protein FliK [bacterium]